MRVLQSPPQILQQVSKFYSSKTDPNIGVVQSYMHEPGTNAQEEGEELLIQGRLQIDASVICRDYIFFLSHDTVIAH